MTENWLDKRKWNEEGLLPVITQDVGSGRILMHAWINRSALVAAQNEGRAIYWSRSRSELWRKGEKSGHVQKLSGIYLDCDADSLIYEVKQIGGIACHTGRLSCFYRKLENNEWQDIEPILKAPEDIYKK